MKSRDQQSICTESHNQGMFQRGNQEIFQRGIKVAYRRVKLSKVNVYKARMLE